VSRLSKKLIQELEQISPGRVRCQESMQGYTTFHCSAVAEAIVTPHGGEELEKLVCLFVKENLTWGDQWRAIGRGSNLLVRDGGYPGVLVLLTEGFSRIDVLEEKKDSVLSRVEAGVPNSALLKWTRERNLKGFGFSFGIPGSVGGGIRMNAGTPLGWFSDVVTHVEGVDLLGRKVGFPVTGQDFRYRDFPRSHDLIVTAGHFLFRRGTPQEVGTEIEAARAKRVNQPLDVPNVGSIFKNPPNDFAGRLIEGAGLKGRTVGDAQISPRHANFIVNMGKARTAEVLTLMKLAQDEVKKKFGVDLEPEVHLIGVDA
jgi:UDP-N-acetylmuramate dehydrogenase